MAKVRSVLTNLGVDGNLFVQADGSGLSRKNLISPKSLVLFLRAILQKAPSFVNILPVAGTKQMRSVTLSYLALIYHIIYIGESGTLKYRFVGTPAQGVVFAKTGKIGSRSVRGSREPN